MHRPGKRRSTYDGLQAVLIGAAGLLPSQRVAASSILVDHPYIQELEARWGTYGPELSIRSMDAKDWHFSACARSISLP